METVFLNLPQPENVVLVFCQKQAAGNGHFYKKYFSQFLWLGLNAIFTYMTFILRDSRELARGGGRERAYPHLRSSNNC